MYISYQEYDFDAFCKIPILKRGKGNPAGKAKCKYKDVVTAFDIETTNIDELEQAVMYIWQWQIGDTTIIGRTWHEFLSFLRKLDFYLEQQDCTMVVYVHNLSFEFQFLSGLLDFKTEDVFAVDSRKVLKATYKHFEFRCSYLQTNMSLRAFCEKMGVKNYKLKMDYRKKRYWYTELTDKEIAYCINDVRGLVEAITKEMERDGDNLYTIPLTSTGYARRDAKAAMRQVGRNNLAQLMPNYKVYELLRAAFRGGNTHANRYYTDRVLYADKVGPIKSADRSSSYPDVICNEKYPMSKFFFKESCTWEELEDLIFKKEKAVIVRCSISNLTLRDKYWPVPYIAKSKCSGVVKAIYDNGRILEAEYINDIVLTDIDLKIICDEYDCEIYPREVAYARYGYLPEPLRKTVLSYYQAKTNLKDRASDSEHDADFYELLYNKSKNLLNAQYGMMAQCPVKVSIKYTNEAELFEPDTDVTPEELLLQHNKRSYLAYQWGCWVTAWARWHLEQGIKLCHNPEHGSEFLYCDTDSCKYIGEVDWSGYNKDRQELSEKNGVYAKDTNGKVHYMGIFEPEDKLEAEAFKTMGAKKYAYITKKDHKLHITIAGVNKKIGAIELNRAGGIEAMAEHLVFHYAGGLQAKYNDYPEVTSWTTPDGVTLKITRNVCLLPNTKTLGIAAEYRELISVSNMFNIDI